MSTENTRDPGVAGSSISEAVAAETGDLTPVTSAIYASLDAASNPQRQYQWQLDGYLTGGSNPFGANVDTISAEYTGAGVRIGLIDEGFDLSHPDLAGRFDLVASYDPRDDGVSNIMPDSASNVHGTWVAGVLGARGDDNFGMIGVAPDSTLIGFYARFGLGGSLRNEMTDLLARQVNVDISSNSWGYTSAFGDNFLDPAWASMRDALQLGASEGRDGLGTVFVFAAGNDRQYIANSLSYDGDNANYHSLTNSRAEITVAASTSSGHIAPFSTPGASVFVTAPGASVLTTMVVQSDPASAFGFVSGTSFAAPIVSGVVAMMLEANPNLGYRDVQDILAMSARVIDPASPSWATNGATNWNGGGHQVSHDFGFGLVDAHAAVRLAETWTTQHTAANESVISLAGDIGSQSDLIDFQPNQYTATVSADHEGFSIQWVEVDVSILHSFVGDLRIRLIGPTGTESLLVDQPGGGNSSRDNLHFTFSTNHDWGESPVGTWTLVVEDAGTGGTGSMQSFALRFYGDEIGNDNTYFYTDDFAALAGDRAALSDASGSDTINAAAVTTDLFIDLNAGATSTIAGRSVLIASATTIENVFGGDGNDTLIGNDADNLLRGGHGIDTLVGGAGNDTYVIDCADILIENADEGTDAVQVVSSYSLAANFENLTLIEAGGAINGTGNAQDNVIAGNSSANVLIGGDGNDTLNGGGGADAMVGGLGNDAYTVDNAGDTVTEGLGEGTDTVLAFVSYTLTADVENLTLADGAGAIEATGNILANVITGNSSDNKLDGVGGVDTLTGGSGNDTYYVHNAATQVIELAGEGIDTVIADVDYDLPDNVEALILIGSATHVTVDTAGQVSPASDGSAGSSASDIQGKTLVANATMASVLSGGFGNDLLVGTAAAGSSLSGGSGNDGYVVFNASDVIHEQAGEGNDTIYARADYCLPVNVETLYLLGAAAHGTGGDSGSVLVANPNLPSTLLGGVAADLFVGAHNVTSTLIGAGGNDIYVIFNSGDAIQEVANGGEDTVYARADYVLPTHVETLYLVDNATRGTGNDEGSVLVANSGLSSVLVGGASADLIIGSHGGSSTLMGQGGDDTYIVFNSHDSIVEHTNGGNDTVFALADFVLSDNAETLYLAGSASHGGASNLGSTLVANASIDSTLSGGSGGDLIVGSHGSVTTMVGGAGSDTYVVFNSADMISEQTGGGADIVVTYADYTLPENIETLILHPAAGAINGLGGSTGNSIVGNAGANVIDGGGGADALVGGGGNDIFVFRRGEANGDVVSDFNADAALDHLMFYGYGRAMDGATFTQLDGTRWNINSSDGLVHDVITFSNAVTIHANDFMFA